MHRNGACTGNGSTRTRWTRGSRGAVDSPTSDQIQTFNSFSMRSQNLRCDWLQEQLFHQSWLSMSILHSSQSPTTQVGSYHRGVPGVGVRQCVWNQVGFLLMMQIILRFSRVYIKIFTTSAWKLQFAICKFCKFKFTKDLLRLQRMTRFLAIFRICLQ